MMNSFWRLAFGGWLLVLAGCVSSERAERLSDLVEAGIFYGELTGQMTPEKAALARAGKEILLPTVEVTASK